MTSSNSLTLDDLLEEIEVIEIVEEDQLERVNVDGWWAVADNQGIIAYFGHELDAFRFRQYRINELMNHRPRTP